MFKNNKTSTTSKLQNCFCFTAVGFVFSAAAPIETVEGKCLAKMNIGKVLLLWSTKIRSVWELLKIRDVLAKYLGIVETC